MENHRRVLDISPRSQMLREEPACELVLLTAVLPGEIRATGVIQVQPGGRPADNRSLSGGFGVRRQMRGLQDFPSKVQKRETAPISIKRSGLAREET